MFISLIFGGVLGSVFLRFGGQSVPNGKTWRHFSSYVAAKLESWKLGFRVHQTLLFQVLRGWFRTSCASFSNIFSGMGFETWFYHFLRNWGSSRSSKDDFWWTFQVQVLRWFFMNFRGHSKFHVGQRLKVIWVVLGALTIWLLTTESRHPSRRYMKDGCW